MPIPIDRPIPCDTYRFGDIQRGIMARRWILG